MASSQLPNLAAQIEGIEWILLLIILAGLFLFGPTKLPELARALGRAWGEFQRGRMELEREIRRQLAEPPPLPPMSPLERAAEFLGVRKTGSVVDLRLAMATAVDRASEGQLREAARALRLSSLEAPVEDLRKAILEAITR